MAVGAPSYKGFRFPAEIISHCVWLYHRFSLSFREIEEMMLRRGITVSHETVRQWCAKFGQTYANSLRRRRPRPGDKWHVDEVFIKSMARPTTCGGGGPARQRAGHPGHLPARRQGATRFFRKLLTGLEYLPRVLVTDKLASYPVAHRPLMRSVEHRRSKYLNNGRRTPIRPPGNKRAMKRFTSPGHVQRFLSAFSGISPHFWSRRHRLTAEQYRHEMTSRFATWNDVVGLPTAS